MANLPNKDTFEISEFDEKLRDIQIYLITIFNNVGDPIFVKDEKCRLLIVNDAFCSIFGLPRNEIIGKTLIEKVPPHEREHFLSIDRKVLKEGKEILCEETLTTSGEPTKTILTRKNRFVDSKGNYFLVGIIHDITDRKKLEAELGASEQRFRDIALNSADWIWEIDKNGIYTFVSDSVQTLLGYQPDEILGKTPFDLMSPDEAIRVTKEFRKIADSKIPFKDLENIVIGKDGHVHITLTSGTPIFDIEGKFQGYRGVDRDITQHRGMENIVREQAFHDELTKLPNRRLFFDRLNQSMAASKRSGFYGALLFMDLDNFKPVNDLYGHYAGDSLLIEMSNRLKRCIREVDTVARFGGDEFAVLLNSLEADKTKTISQAIKVAEKIAEETNRPYKLENKKGDNTHFIEHHCSVSIGVALFLDSASPDEIVKWADTAMYEAKNNCRNTIHVFNPDEADSTN